MVAVTEASKDIHEVAATSSRTSPSSSSIPPSSSPCATSCTAIDGPGNASTTTDIVSPATEITHAACYVIASPRPWSQLMDCRRFEKPASVADASERMRKNLAYFRANYVLCMLILIGLACLLSLRPASLIVLGVLWMLWAHFYFCRSGRPVVVLNQPFSDRSVSGILGISTIVTLFFAGTGSALTCPLALGLLLTCIHAMLRQPDDLFLEGINM